MKPLRLWQSLLIRAAATVLSSGGHSSSLAILIFHRVLPEPDPMLRDEPDIRRFSALMDLIGSNFRVLLLRDAVCQLHSGALPPRAICITFDDGYANNCEVAMPVLIARGLPATVFVATGYLNGGAMFNDIVIEALRVAPEALDLRGLGLGQFKLSDFNSRRKVATMIIERLKYGSGTVAERLNAARNLAAACGLHRMPQLMLHDDQVVKLHRNGIEIGAHTVTHPILTRVNSANARDEIVESKRRLEHLVGAPVTSFAFPNGDPSQDYSIEHVNMVREAGFHVALTTAWGTATADADPLQLPRLAPWDQTAMRYSARIAASYRQRRYTTTALV